MRRFALLSALAALPALAQEALPPPPPPPSVDPAPLPPPPPGTGTATPRRPGDLRPRTSGPPRKPGTIGEAPVAPAGSQAAPLHPEETYSHWRFALATGVSSKFGGMQLHTDEENPTVLLYFGGQADGLWTEGYRYGQAARIRFRMFTGGESEVYVPSDGEVEAAYMIGQREFRFVIGRLEVGRYPALGIAVLAQLATLPCFEGSLSLGGDTMRLYYHLSPIEAAFVRYYGRAHIQHRAGWPNEADTPVAASTGRLRYTVLLPPAVLLSLQGDLVKMWKKPDLLVSAEGSLGYQALEQSAVFNLALRWNGYTRRGTEPETEKAESEIVILGIASLVF
jgi:hypothetical protein